MKSIFYSLLCILILFACSGEKPRSQEATVSEESYTTGKLPIPHDSVLMATINENLTGLNNEDVGWAKNPLHTNSPFMVDPTYHIQGSFLVYDMKFTLVSVDIESKSEFECTAVVVHDSQNFNDNSYDPQRSTQRYTWRPDGDKWKIYKMEVIGSTPLWDVKG